MNYLYDLIGIPTGGFIAQYLNSHIAFLIAGYILSAIAAYLLGSINFAVLISKHKFKQDIRTFGSGNAGMSNMLRTYGKTAAAMTLLGDALKTAVSIFIAVMAVGMTGAYIGGLFSIIGHVYPIYYKFKGGKGVVTAAITALFLNPLIFAVMIGIFVLTVLVSRYISLGSITAAAFFPLLVYIFEGPGMSFVFALVIAVFIIFLHRQNINRLINKEENKISLNKKGNNGKKQ